MTLYILRRDHSIVYRYGSLTVWQWPFEFHGDAFSTARVRIDDEPWSDFLNGQIWEGTL